MHNNTREGVPARVVLCSGEEELLLRLVEELQIIGVGLSVVNRPLGLVTVFYLQHHHHRHHHDQFPQHASTPGLSTASERNIIHMQGPDPLEQT